MGDGCDENEKACLSIGVTDNRGGNPTYINIKLDDSSLTRDLIDRIGVLRLAPKVRVAQQWVTFSLPFVSVGLLDDLYKGVRDEATKQFLRGIRPAILRLHDPLDVPDANALVVMCVMLLNACPSLGYLIDHGCATIHAFKTGDLNVTVSWRHPCTIRDSPGKAHLDHFTREFLEHRPYSSLVLSG